MATSGFYAIDGTLGANLNRTHASGDPQFEVGTTVITNQNKVAIYVKAGGIISTSAGAAVNVSFIASASAGGFIALGSFNDGDLGWVRSSADHTP